MSFGVSAGGAWSPLSMHIDVTCSQGMSMLSNRSLPCLSSLNVQILKYDVLTKSSLKWGQEHCWPAEPLFVPTPDAKDEDDGRTPGRGARLLHSACDHPSNRDSVWGQQPSLYNPHIRELVEPGFETQVCLSPKLWGEGVPQNTLTSHTNCKLRGPQDHPRFW